MTQKRNLKQETNAHFVNGATIKLRRSPSKTHAYSIEEAKGGAYSITQSTKGAQCENSGFPARKAGATLPTKGRIIEVAERLPLSTTIEDLEFEADRLRVFYNLEVNTEKNEVVIFTAR